MKKLSILALALIAACFMVGCGEPASEGGAKPEDIGKPGDPRAKKLVGAESGGGGGAPATQAPQGGSPGADQATTAP